MIYFWTHLDRVRFILRHGDADLMNMLNSSVPPVDISKIGIFADAVRKYQSQARPIQQLVETFNCITPP